MVVGARSAVFAPARQLGLIVIDEEHEGTFKQEATPRYHARDVAVMRARLKASRFCLARPRRRWKAGATPNRPVHAAAPAQPRAANRPLPKVGLIDLRHEP